MSLTHFNNHSRPLNTAIFISLPVHDINIYDIFITNSTKIIVHFILANNKSFYNLLAEAA